MLRLKPALWTALVAVAFLTVPLYAALTDDLKAFYSLDDANDAHLNGYHLTNNGTVTFVAGKVGNAGDFESGSSQYLSRADNADFSVGNMNFTLAAWFRIESCGNGSVVQKAGANDLEYDLRVDASCVLSFRVSSSAGFTNLTTIVTAGSLSTATWYYAVAWHSATDDKIYLSVDDGTAVEGAYSAGSYDSGASFRIGGYSDYSEYFDGLIDQVGFWKRALTSQERTDLYNAGSGLSYAGMGGGSAPAAPCRLLLLGAGCELF
jgi:hypothetical protein